MLLSVLLFTYESNLLSLCNQPNKPQPSTTTFVLNQLNHLPSLGAVVTKQSATNNIKHTITVTKVVHVPNSALRNSSTSPTNIAASASTVVPSTRSDQVHFFKTNIKWKCQSMQDRTKNGILFILCYIFAAYIFAQCFFHPKQIQLKDLLRTGNVKSSDLKGGSLMELMKLKPPPNITTPVATATGTGHLFFCLNTDIYCLEKGRKGKKCIRTCSSITSFLQYSNFKIYL